MAKVIAQQRPQGIASFESRTARLVRLRDEVRSGTYQVDPERLALCLLARSSLLVAFGAGGGGRPLDGRLSC